MLNSFLRCSKLFDDRGHEKFNLPPLTVERRGYEVEVGGLTSDLVTLGLIAGIEEPSEATLGNLELFMSKFKDAGVHAILVAGGVGLPAEHVRAILEGLAAAPVPVLVCPGAQESFELFRAEIADARRRHPQILDMTLVRKVRLGHVSIVSIPGYQKAFYLEAGERGCAYEESDLEETASLFEKDRTTVVLSPSPLRGVGEHAVDRGRGGVNMGDPSLSKVLVSRGVRFAAFGYAYESGGNATLNDARTPISAGIWNESVFIQSGAADAVPIELVKGGKAVGMAHVLDLSGKRGRFRTILASRLGR